MENGDSKGREDSEVKKDSDSEGREDSEVPTMYYSKSIAIQHII